MKPTHIIRRCNGNTACWTLCSLKPDGTEIDMNFSNTTSYSINALLTMNAKYLEGATILLQVGS